MQRHTTPKKEGIEEKALEKMHLDLDVFRSKVHAAKVAFLNRTPLDGKEVSYEDLRTLAEEYIRRNYAYQRARFGKVKVKMSVAKLLR